MCSILFPLIDGLISSELPNSPMRQNLRAGGAPELISLLVPVLPARAHHHQIALLFQRHDFSTQDLCNKAAALLYCANAVAHDILSVPGRLAKFQCRNHA
jgi:hypothetical protein